jgi:hypothetical protein
MEVKVFVRDDCPRCPAALEACRGITALQVYDLDDARGLVEASQWSVSAVPAVLVVDSTGREVAGWRGEAPDAATLRRVLAH